MPICPKCKQEYDEGVMECADCVTPLVDQLEAETQAQGMEAAFFRAENEEVLDLMHRALTIHQHIPIKKSTDLPHLELDGFYLLAPAPLAGHVVKILDFGVPELISDGEGEDKVYRFYKGDEEKEIRNPEILQRSLSELAEEGDKNLEELAQIVVRGDAQSQGRAAYVLACLGENGEKTLITLLKAAIEKEQSETVLSIIRVIRKELDAAYAFEEFAPYLEGSDSAKILTLNVFCALENPDAFPLIMPLLEDPNPEVRNEADNALCELSDEDFGFEAEDPEEKRNKVITQWKHWWAGRKNG